MPMTLKNKAIMREMRKHGYDPIEVNGRIEIPYGRAYGSNAGRLLAQLGRGVKKTMSEAAMNQRRSAAKISAKKRKARRASSKKTQKAHR